MKRITLLFISLVICTNNIEAKSLDGLVVTGLDTLKYYHDRGFDFAFAQKCTTIYSSDPCIRHLEWGHYGGGNDWRIWALDEPSGYGRSIPYGKINLDSINAAPPDSVFNRYSFWADSIPADSFSSRIGNVYVLRMGIDRRNNCSYYAKIKVINIIPHDTARHEVDLVFLWAFNLNNRVDLVTTGLDTFHLDTVPTHSEQARHTRSLGNSFSTTSKAFLLSGNNLKLPSVFAFGKTTGIYSITGRFLARIPIAPDCSISFSNIYAGKAIIIKAQ